MRLDEENMDGLGIDKTHTMGARVKFLALGSAACRALNYFFSKASILSDLCLAVDTDLRCLESLHPSLPKFCFEKNHFRGLSSGGDEALVEQMFEKDAAPLHAFCQKTDILILLVGLGGGTGGGACLKLVQLAIQWGAFVLSIPIVPFSFEGQSKAIRVQSQLKSLQLASDLMVPFNNDILFQSLSDAATIKEAFTEGDAWLSRLMKMFFIYLTQNTAGALEGNLNNFVKHFSDKPEGVFWGIGFGEGERASEQALRSVFDCPFWRSSKGHIPIKKVFMFSQLGSGIPLVDLKNLYYELQGHLGSPEIQVLNAYAELAEVTSRVEIFILGSYCKQNLKAARYRKRLGNEKISNSQNIQIQFDFDDAGSEAYWDTPTYLRHGLKLD
ncbi:MAG: hypothetical protein LBE99_03465 [Puniceicoccales bacterium]|jgi:cell division protein FtsZ|nr:hypothetical protein [Puniceicoccales bacterium]